MEEKRGCMKKKTKIIIAVLIMALNVFAIAPGVSAAVTNQSIAIPVYQYPTLPFWNDITAAGSQIPFVVVNPASGPGVAVDPNYTNQIATNTTAGQRSIGYVDSNYQTRPIANVLADIDQWRTLYPGITGYMIDRVSTGSAADLFYTAYIYNYIKAKYPNDVVVHNFGTYTNPQYEPYGDVFINAEMDYALYNSSWTVPTDGFQDNPAYQNRFWHILHTTSGSDLAAALTKTRNSNAGWVYITDDVLPNPYDDTPTYWSTELTNVGTLPASTIPNRGQTALPATDLLLTPHRALTPTIGSTQNNYEVVLSVENTSTTYSAISPTTVTFSLPAGASLANASGTGWSCVGNTCTYANDIAPATSSADLTVSFAIGCDFSSGNIGLTYEIFAGNTTTDSISVSGPTACGAESPAANGSSGGLADTGMNAAFVVTLALLLMGSGVGALFFARRFLGKL